MSFELRISDLSKTYSNGVCALDHVSLAIPTGMFGLVGPNGAGKTHMWVGRVRLGKHEPSAKELAYVRRLYRGELQVIDQALGRLLDGLGRAQLLDDAIVVFLGVHGEEFFEHRGAGHGRTLYDESLRVPLAIRAPQLLAPGRVVMGLGASSHAMVEGWHGIPFEKPLTRVKETALMLRKMLTGERENFAGETLTRLECCSHW